MMFCTSLLVLTCRMIALKLKWSAGARAQRAGAFATRKSSAICFRIRYGTIWTTFYFGHGTRQTERHTPCIDSGGHHTDEVYRFAKERLNRRIFAIKGMGGAGVPFIRNPSKNNRVRADLFILGVDAGKTTIYQRLEVKTPGPNYCHFPSNEEAGYTEEYFKGLTAEKKVVRFVKGHLKEYWEIKDKEHKRNEPLDLRNYATAALAISRPVLKKPDADGTPAQPVKKSRGRRQLSGGI